ncbi:hypothetical protein BGW39_003649 [Mortierella sp. 14UC]|nr:hypothetical protein BGW39_003649 [Mortierella sp. 14UC]
MDVAPTCRWNIKGENEIDWFFGGVVGDTPEGPGKSWKAGDDDTEEEKEEEAVFTQLSRLYHIQTFISTSWEIPLDPLELQLKLDYGLDLLCTWSNSIENVRLGCRDPYNMNLADSQWILDHWPHLKSMVCENFSSDGLVDHQIWHVLTTRRVSFM